MKKILTKILFISVTFIFFISCSAIKNIPEDDFLLSKNEIFEDSIKTNKSSLYNQLYQTPNEKILGIPFRLHIYNSAAKNPDSLFNQWLYKKPNREKKLAEFISQKQVNRLRESYTGFNNWLKRTGEPPTIIDSSKIKRSLKKLESYYWNHGWFNIKTDYSISKKEKQRANISYFMSPGQPYFLDSIQAKIESPIADSLYQSTKNQSKIVSGKQYKTKDVETERERLTSFFRNSGLYNFEKEFIKFDADTVNTNHKVNLNLLINNRQVTHGNSSRKIPFKIHKISKVNIFTDYKYQYRNLTPKDTVQYKGYNIYSYDKLRYTRKAITNSVLITPGEIFRDIDRTLTYNQISNLKTFKYPNIRYSLDPNDPSGSSLIANVLLTPKKKYSTNIEFDVSTSSIQAFGIGFGGSFLIRNVFRGAETLELSARGSIGSSKDASVDTDDTFFNISEVQTDLRLSFPKILFPIKTSGIIRKYMSPTTNLVFGMSIQKNIGLDKQNASGIFNYIWRPSKSINNQIDLVNIQYVRNLNNSNYFNVYSNSYDQLNFFAKNDETYFNANRDNTQIFTPDNDLTIPDGANHFILTANSDNTNLTGLSDNDKQEVQNIGERKERLTEDNLIFASSYTIAKNTKNGLHDEDYYRWRFKFELAGNVLQTISNASGLTKNDNERFEIFGVEFSQYAKAETSYIKHWSISPNNNKVIAFRAFGGIAIPYGNANSIPFARSFFAGGPNDNRAWLAYRLGPGTSQSTSEFNEANMKLAFNLEYRYTILGALKGAFFIDAGNIWNVEDSVEKEEAIFSKIDNLQDIAVGSGLGLRYDFDFFVLRFDLGFKTFNPANNEDQRWFKGYNFSKAVYNVGINYPF
ncbi:BamA/TamA family outer membrane protein [Aquimarina sp. TRL1]|uniref:translocation and assembly module lipoprotein TamL n=1 Tax=Aquimarina sp. (strain TRL1) TaxID=2736252 RepID=UPI00158F6017|nr:BamA/TamA family outer membrane protein [Aquimarina sp. TRL1]QKX05529.1 BamA/TamA family outer membrane protein [Aquimarina sp. TRL1]